MNNYINIERALDEMAQCYSPFHNEQDDIVNLWHHSIYMDMSNFSVCIHYEKRSHLYYANNLDEHFSTTERLDEQSSLPAADTCDKFFSAKVIVAYLEKNRERFAVDLDVDEEIL